MRTARTGKYQGHVLIGMENANPVSLESSTHLLKNCRTIFPSKNHIAARMKLENNRNVSRLPVPNGFRSEVHLFFFCDRRHVLLLRQTQRTCPRESSTFISLCNKVADRLKDIGCVDLVMIGIVIVVLLDCTDKVIEL